MYKDKLPSEYVTANVYILRSNAANKESWRKLYKFEFVGEKTVQKMGSKVHFFKRRIKDV